VANNRDINEWYKKIPKSIVLSEINDHRVTKWQSEQKAQLQNHFFPE
jgi:hypothetical protein